MMLKFTLFALLLAFTDAYPPTEVQMGIRDMKLYIDPHDLTMAEVDVTWHFPSDGHRAETRISVKNTPPGELPSRVSFSSGPVR